MSRINNSFRLSGFVGSEPEKRFNPNNGKGIMSLSLGVDASYKSRDTGEVVDRTDWIDLTCFYDGLVNVVEQYVHKGTEIHVRGIIRKQKWESKDRIGEDGKPLMDTRYQFIVTELRLGRRAKDDSAAAPANLQELDKANADAAQAATDFDDDIPY